MLTWKLGLFGPRDVREISPLGPKATSHASTTKRSELIFIHEK